jgi:hypothetical protein
LGKQRLEVNFFDLFVMDRLYRTVAQIQIAKEAIQIGDVAHLRVALILLDNAVEVMMYRVVQSEFFHSDWHERMLNTMNLPGMPIDQKSEEFRRKLEFEVIPRKRRKELNRYFGAKVKFLTERGRIPQQSARALNHLHDYRNETQHKDEVREDSIRAAVMLLFDITTDFLVRLHPGYESWASDADYSWLDRYGIKRHFPASDKPRERIAKQLRSDLPLDDVEIRQSLIVHLTDRLDGMEAQLDSICEDTVVKNAAEALRWVQFWKGTPAPTPAQLPTFVVSHDLTSIANWRVAVEKLSAITDKLEMFDRFATIEDEFEPLEKMIDEVVGEIDAHIQLEMDIARGK